MYSIKILRSRSPTSNYPCTVLTPDSASARRARGFPTAKSLGFPLLAVALSVEIHAMALVKKGKDCVATVSNSLLQIQQGKPETASKQLVSLKKDGKIITALTAHAALQPDMFVSVHDGNHDNLCRLFLGAVRFELNFLFTLCTLHIFSPTRV